MKYECGSEVMDGDIIERVGDSLSLDVGGQYTTIVPSMSMGLISVKENCTMNYDPLFFKLIKRKQEPEMVWKEMTLEEVKAVQVGDKIRIDGVEDEVIYLYDRVKGDYGFKTKKEHQGCNVVNSSHVEDMEYKFEKLVEETEMNNRLERTKEYDVKLTGEDIAKLYLVTGSTYGMHKAYATFGALLGADGESMRVELPSIKLNAAIGYEATMRKLLAKPETEDQRKLRELKEQYESLGKAIDAMEKK